MSPPSPIPTPSLAGISPPQNPLLAPALAYLQQHTSAHTVNHSLRSAYFALLLARKLPQYSSLPHLNQPLIFLSCALHDLGWSTTKHLLSQDKRFEVDGANLAVALVEQQHHAAAGIGQWTPHDLEVLWTAIALHATPSIAAHHPVPEIGVVHLGILADFFGPNLPPPFPPGTITEAEYKEIEAAYPMKGFRQELVQIMCGLCREKRETTFDNFVAEFGKLYGTDGEGGGREEFRKEWESRQMPARLMEGLERLERLVDGN